MARQFLADDTEAEPYLPEIRHVRSPTLQEDGNSWKQRLPLSHFSLNRCIGSRKKENIRPNCEELGDQGNFL